MTPSENTASSPRPSPPSNAGTGTLQVLKEDGTDVTSSWSGTWPNEIEQGEVMPWMKDPTSGDQIVAQKLTFKIGIVYTLNNAAGGPGHTVAAPQPHIITCRATCTNSAAGTVPYSQTTSLGDSYFTGLAENVYNSLSPLAYEGEHEIIETLEGTGTPCVSTIIDPRYVLNISGGESAWSTMKATIQSVDIDFLRGSTRIKFGPPKHISPGDLEQLLQWYRWRIVRDSSQLPSTGNAGDSAPSTGGEQKTENTSSDTVIPAVHTVIAPIGDNATQIQADAVTNLGINIATVTPSTGAPAGSGPIINVSLNDITAAGTTNNAAKFRLFQFYVQNSDGSCSLKQAAVLMTAPEAAG